MLDLEDFLPNIRLVVSDMDFIEFDKWLCLGDDRDVFWVIKELESEEMYEYCIVAKDHLKNNYGIK